METAVFNVRGMKCDGCVRGVEAALRGVPGVRVKEVSVGRAVVEREPGAASDGAIAAAIERAGFKAERAGDGS